MISIRKYNSNDFEGLKKILYNVYGAELTLQSLREHCKNKELTIILAFDDEINEVIGSAFIEIKFDYVRYEKISFITYVAVESEYRKRGVGRKLFEYIENYSKELKCTAIELTSANFRKEAHLFYSRLGYSVKDTTVFIKEI